MFLLLLIVLGATNVKAQVRIGGNAAPNAAAVLDLNATDAATTGTKGLALPRVDLTSNTMQLTTGVSNLTGMLVYNTTATLGAGVYYWDSSKWVIVVPAPPAAARGPVLVARPLGAVSWTKELDTNFLMPTLPRGQGYLVRVFGVASMDVCLNLNAYGSSLSLSWAPDTTFLHIFPPAGMALVPTSTTIRCYRPSI